MTDLDALFTALNEEIGDVYGGDGLSRFRFDRALVASQPPSGDALREAAQEVIGAFTIAPGVTTGRQAKALDALRVATLATPTVPAPLDVDAYDKGWRDGHITGQRSAPLDVERLARALDIGIALGQPWVSEVVPYRDYLLACAADIARAYANQEGGDCEHGIPRNECKLIEHDA